MNALIKFLAVFTVLILLSLTACDPQKEMIGPVSPTAGNLTNIDFNPTAYQMDVINGLPAMEIPTDNPMTEEGVRLGRFLFYDRILSIDSSISCGSCHQQSKAFTDGNVLAQGVGGALGTRNSMSLINIGYTWKQNSLHNFNWDGKFANLEDQVIAPVIDPLEMMNTWEEVENRLRAHEHYPRLFRQAFGINNSNEISRVLAAKAMAQFLRTLNSANSSYDRDEWVPFEYMDEAAQRGKLLFLGDFAGSSQTKDGECAHCHNFSRNNALFASNQFMNNAIDSVAAFSEFLDLGLGGITGIASDNGRFRSVTVRNIALTAPYMHDGRFSTLEEVMDHYVDHAGNPNLGPNVAGELATAPTLGTLTQGEKEDIIAFLHALTDTSYVNKEEWSDPFRNADPWTE